MTALAKTGSCRHLLRSSGDLLQLKALADIWAKEDSFWPAKEVLKLFSEKKFEAIVSQSKDGTYTGSLLYLFADQVAEILFIYTEKSWRRQGVASSLLLAFLGELGSSEKLCSYIDLEVRSNNYPAIRFYEQNHFFRVRVRKQYYRDGTDAIVLRKKV